MDIPAFLLGFIVSIWGILQIIYPEESKWFQKKWIEYIEERIRRISLLYLFFGSLSLLIVWYTNSFLILLVLGSFMLYNSLKYLFFGKKVVEMSKISLKASGNRWRVMGAWLLLGGLGLIYLSTWF